MTVEIAMLKQMRTVTQLLMKEDGWLCRGDKLELFPSVEDGLNMKKALVIFHQIFGLVLSHFTVLPARVNGR